MGLIFVWRAIAQMAWVGLGFKGVASLVITAIGYSGTRLILVG